MMDGEVIDIRELLDEIASPPRAITPFGQRAPKHTGKIIHDPYNAEAGNPHFARTVRLQCSQCGTQWSACYEGPNIRHRDDLICFRCTKDKR